MLSFDTGVILPARDARPATSLHLVSYPFGGTAVLGLNGPETVFVATVNLAGNGLRYLEPNQVWLKEWSENENLPHELETAGFLRRTGETTQVGFTKAELAIIDETIMHRRQDWDPDRDIEWDRQPF